MVDKRACHAFVAKDRIPRINGGSGGNRKVAVATKGDRERQGQARVLIMPKFVLIHDVHVAHSNFTKTLPLWQWKAEN